MSKPDRSTGRFVSLLTPAEVGALFGCDAKTVTRWAKDGRLDEAVQFTLGGHRRYKESVILAMLGGAGANGGGRS